MSLTKATYSMIDGPVGNVKDFGALGDGTDQTAAIQSAVNSICGASGVLIFPPGDYRLSSQITFPNKSFRVVGSGPTNTSIAGVVGSSQINLFNLSGINGPSVYIEKMGFFGPSSGTLGGVGCYNENNNGVCIKDCWFSGLLHGIEKINTSSFLRIFNCTFEYCYNGITFSSAIECSINNSSFYRCTNDYNFTGAFSLSTITNSTHSETVNYCAYLDSVTDAIIENITCRQDFAQNLPVIFEMVNTCTRNIVRNVRTFNFGSKLISISSSSSCTNNIFDGLFASIILPVVPPSQSLPSGTGQTGIEIGSGGTNNTFSNFNFYGNTIGIVDAGNANRFVQGVINSCTTGIKLQSSSDNEFIGVQLFNNTNDWSTLGSVSTVWLDDLNGTLSGFSPTRYGKLSAGTSGRIFYGTAIPTSLSYLIGDQVLNISPAVGNPKGWVCTASGTPGTWVSIGNL